MLVTLVPCLYESDVKLIFPVSVCFINSLFLELNFLPVCKFELTDWDLSHRILNDFLTAEQLLGLSGLVL